MKIKVRRARVVSSVLEDARRVIREHAPIVLSERDQRTFVNALLKPPAPHGKLRAAYQKYVKDFGP